ncbi:MAG: SAM-dependent methyltransferase, partial [Candidatus Cloacimonetes bacterium]|nr:SAM-dependent methyltransferase [Candidatus Cloacimonadota bacterium]MDY0230427.1 N-6 DNA methylase [Candidatus Cloacimonadaceae bacterium]
FNNEVLRDAEEDLFGKIYEYFLNEFAMTGAQEGGEFFTPYSLVNTIVNVIEPDHGVVLDPAVGSAGMFVQTGYFIESEGSKPAEKVTFFGQEKTETNTKLAKMNLAVHGLEGSILEGNTFYDDKHDLAAACDFVMANPPFNVDGVDKEKDFVKKDPRLPFGLPRNDNANYLWIQYFYSYLKPTGRAGFVMSSAASDAGHSEKEIREKLVKTGAVDVMLAIGNNFFYTRSLPCTLWFFDRAKEQNPERKDQILMLDARKIYRKVTTKVNDFSPEQLQNLMCIVALYRGNTSKFTMQVDEYLKMAQGLTQTLPKLLDEFKAIYQGTFNILLEFMKTFSKTTPIVEWHKRMQEFERKGATYHEAANKLCSVAQESKAELNNLEPIAKQCHNLRRTLDKLLRELTDLVAFGTKEYSLNRDKVFKELNLKAKLDKLRQMQQELAGNPDEEEPGLLYGVEYFYKQALWLQSRFPDSVYNDVAGLCKVVTQEEVEAKDYSLTPGRYVGVAALIDDDFDYEERLKEIHLELAKLNEEAEGLTMRIADNFNDLLI